MNSHAGYAPCPARGFMKLIWQVLEARGASTRQDIIRYMPAAVENGTTLRPTKAQIKSALYALVYNGFAVKSGNQYRVAPYSYYAERSAMLKAQAERVRQNKKRPPRGSAAPPASYSASNLPTEQLLPPVLEVERHEPTTGRVDVTAVLITVVAFVSGLALGGVVGLIVAMP